MPTRGRRRVPARDFHNCLFGWSPRRIERPDSLPFLFPRRRWKGLSVNLCIRGQRKFLKHHKRARCHVIRKLWLKDLLQAARIQRRTRPREHVSHYLFPPRLIFSQDRHRLANVGMIPQDRLDLSQINPVTAQLHLKIVTPQAFDVAGCMIAGDVAGFV